jgi:hypothetical protein
MWVREEFVDARFEKGVSFAAIIAFSSDIPWWVLMGIARRKALRKLPREGKSSV